MNMIASPFADLMQEINSIMIPAPERALELVEQGLECARRCNDEEKELEFLHCRMKAFNLLKEIEMSLTTFVIAFPMAEHLGNIEMQASLLLTFTARARINGASTTEQLELLLRARDKAIESQNADLLASILHPIAMCYHIECNWTEMLDAAEEILRLTKDPLLRSSALLHLAHIQALLRDYNAGLILLHQGLDLVKELDPIRTAEILHAISFYQIELGRFCDAKCTLERAIVKVPPPWKSALLYSLSDVELYLDNLDASQQYLDECYASVRSPIVRLRADMLRAKLLLKQGNLSASRTLFEELTPDIMEHHPHLVDSYSKLGVIIFEAAHEYEQALYWFKQQHAKEIELQDQHVLVRQTLLQREFALERERFERERQQLRAEKLERELSAKAMELATQSEAMDRFRTSFHALFQSNRTTEDAIQKAKELVKSLPTLEVEWSRFEADFVAAHPNFKQSLTEKYPDLSTMEVRISTLLRLNVKSSDIARLFSITERTVEYHRLNLRRKLRLSKDNSLHRFLCEFH